MRKFRIHEISAEDFEHLVIAVCHQVLGTGTFAFAQGRDGGRDGRFKGTASNFPSEHSPITGKMIIQAKHTTNASASCSDPKFDRILRDEEPKIRQLAHDSELDYYLLFTNRRVPAARDNIIVSQIKGLHSNIKDAYLFGLETLESHLWDNPAIWTNLGFDRYESPLRIHPKELGGVIQSFYDAREGIATAYESAYDLAPYVVMSKKNRINGLSAVYYEYIQEDSLPYFGEVENFLENPRNQLSKEQYHATVDEIRAKLVQGRSRFDTFDNVLEHFYDLVVDGNPDLAHRRRLAHVFLHYMYCSCDIGKKC